MKLYTMLKHHLAALTDTVTRYPVSTLYLMAIALVRFLTIENISNHRILYDHIFAALVIGFFISINVRRISEAIKGFTFSKLWALYALTLILTGLYFVLIYSESPVDTATGIRTTVLCFGLLISFLWIGSHSKQAPHFYQSFMNGFKALVISLFFSGVLFLGLALILAAIDTLLFDINENLYMHFTTFVFMVFSPLFALSLIPNYSSAPSEDIQKATQGTRFLETLLSYIIIPLIGIFTLILLIYIVLNIQDNFWTENLLEPMLVSYSIVVISVLLLSVSYENTFVRYFHRIFPKVLIPLVFLQLIASILKINDLGLTHGRYFVILYGIFALLSGIIFSFLSPKRLGLLAICFIVSAIVASVPPIDAFSLSKHNQMQLIEEILLQENMLIDGQLLPKPDLDTATKDRIITLTTYAYRMGYLKEFSWIDEDFVYYEDFNAVFGFNQYERPRPNKTDDGFYYTYNRDSDEAIPINGYSHLTNISISYFMDEDPLIQNTSFSIDNASYRITWSDNKNLGQFSLYDETDKLLIALDTETYDATTYESENALARLKLIPNYINLNQENAQITSLNADIILLIDIK